MVRRYDFDRSVQNTFEQSLPVLFGTQRRIHPEPPVILDIILCQSEIVGRRLAADPRSPLLRLPYRLHAFLRGDVACVIPASGFLRQTHVAPDHPPFPLRIVLVVSILAMFGNHAIALGGQFHRMPDDPLVHYSAPVVGKSCDIGP